MPRERSWSLPGVVAALVLAVSACSPGGESAADCETAFVAAATSVPGVASAKWDCSNSFGGGWQRADVVLSATSEPEAVRTMEALLRAFARSPDILDRWSTPQEYKTVGGKIVVGVRELGFPGVPNVGEVRQRWGITPG